MPVVVRQADPADVAALARAQVEPAEGEPLLDGGELAQPLGVEGVEGVPLAAAGGRGDDGGAPDLLQRPLGALAEGVEVGVQPVDVLLLPDDLAVEVAVQVCGAQRVLPGAVRSAARVERSGRGKLRPSSMGDAGRARDGGTARRTVGC